MNLENHHHFLTYNTRHVCLTKWLNDFSAHIKTKPENSKIEYPGNFASGFAAVDNIEHGLIYRIVDYTINTDFVFSREPTDDFFLLIYFYQYVNAESLLISFNNETVSDTQGKDFSAVAMTNSFTHQRIELKKGTVVKGLTIQLSEEWLKQKVENYQAYYSLLREKNLFKDFLSAKSKKLLNEIFGDSSNSLTPALYINIRILRLLEGFFKSILSDDYLENSLSLSNEDFQRLLTVEEILIANYASDFPKIENLARIALMSETKLKNIFKKAFGMGLFEYYQKNRMHKAKELLDMNKYTVSEVGTMIGYQNLSNFSNAFKKEFGHLPKNSDKIG